MWLPSDLSSFTNRPLTFASAPLHYCQPTSLDVLDPAYEVNVCFLCRSIGPEVLPICIERGANSTQFERFGMQYCQPTSLSGKQRSAARHGDLKARGWLVKSLKKEAETLAQGDGFIGISGRCASQPL